MDSKKEIVKAILKIEKLDTEALREILLYALVSIDPTVILESMKQVLMPEQVKKKDEAVEPRGKEICIVVSFGETFWTEEELSKVKNAYRGDNNFSRGGKIWAIKEVRNLKGYGLAESKEVVEEMLNRGFFKI